jgi:integrase
LKDATNHKPPLRDRQGYEPVVEVIEGVPMNFAAKIPDFRFHDLRHTAATRFADGGAEVFTIAAILGPATIQMSARYTHATDEGKRRAVERLLVFGIASPSYNNI